MTEHNGGSDTVRIDAGALTRVCRDLFVAAGMPLDDADLSARQLVSADLRGVESHGVVRMGIYLERLQHGVIAAHPQMSIARETRSTAVFDGGNGMGQVAGQRAMELAVAKAREHGEPTFVSVRNSNHFGAAAWFADIAAQSEMIGLAFTIGGINHMVPWGGAEAMLGNNPFAVAFPLRGDDTMMLDMACSVAARGKILVAAKEGRAIPADWAVNRDGQPTTDAVEALAGFVAPVGGPKGYALTLTIGLLSTMLSGAYFGSEVTHMYDDFEHPQNIGHLFGVLPITAFEDLDTYFARMDKAAADIRGVRRAPGVEQVWLPGHREASLARERSAHGIPVGQETWRELSDLGRAHGVAVPSPLGV